MVKKKYSLYTILNKSLKYKDKHNLSDKEFKIFKKKYVKLLNISNNSKNYTILKQINQNQYMTNKINMNEIRNIYRIESAKLPKFKKL